MMKRVMKNWRRFTEEKAESTRQFSSFVVFINPEDKVLILKRQELGGPRSGLWSLVGGGAELGEEPEDAAHREALEETGMTINKIDHVYTKNDKNKDIHFFRCLDFTGDVQKDKVLDEHDDFKWINPSDLDQYHTLPELERVIRKAFGTNIIL